MGACKGKINLVFTADTYQIHKYSKKVEAKKFFLYQIKSIEKIRFTKSSLVLTFCCNI